MSTLIEHGVPANILDATIATTTATTTGATFAMPVSATQLEVQTVFSTVSPASVTVLVESSMDGVTWATRVSTTTTTGAVAVATILAPLVRASVTSIGSGGDNLKVWVMAK